MSHAYIYIYMCVCVCVCVCVWVSEVFPGTDFICVVSFFLTEYFITVAKLNKVY